MRILLASVAVVTALVAAVAAADLSGTWALEFQRNGSRDVYQANCAFKQEGDRFSGSCMEGFEAPVPVRGRVTDTGVTFQFTNGVDAGATATFSGTLDEKETELKGTWRFVDPQGAQGEGTFTAMKR